MELKKYKICPSCGEHNAPNKIECRNCEADLTGVKVVDRAQEPAPAQSAETPVGASAGLFRICDCGQHNPPQARKCSACGEDISDILPTPAIAEAPPCFAYRLITPDGAFSVELSAPVAVIGRQAELKEYLAAKPYVSRTHAKLTIVAEKVFIENISATNKTFVNNVLIEDGKPHALENGDEIGLGGMLLNGERQEHAAYFIFSIKP